MGDCFSAPEVSRSEHFDAIESKLKTGDILLVCGNSPFSKLIKFGTRTKWTHVGMIVKLKTPMRLGQSEILSTERAYILQSTADTMENIPDLLEGKVSPGVQLNLLEDVIYYDDDKVYIRQIQGVDLTVTYPVKQYIESKSKTPYEQNIFELINAATKANMREDDRYLFCSEFVAELYYQFNVAKRASNDFSNNQTPADFSEDSGDPFVFRRGISLGETIKIVK